MRRRDVLDPEVARELAALDAALAGEAVDELVRAVRAERPEIPPQFARDLDTRVQAGFAGPRSARRRLSIPRVSRRTLMPALGAAASLLVALVVVASLSSGGEDMQPAPQNAPAPARGGTAESLATSATGDAVAPDDESAVAPGAARRVERQASVVLTAPAGEVPEVSDGVIRATDEVGGIVASSSVSTGDDGRAGASFQLRVPTRRLDDALARLSKLGHVRSRTQSSQDVTASFVSARERLDEALAERKGLLRQLAGANTQNETASIRERLRIVRAEISSARASLRRLRVRTDYSVVSVSVVTDGEGGAATGGGNWTPEDAARDAVRVLEVLAGATLVSLAVLRPLALLGLFVAAGARTARRRGRERALSA
jgi:hypothetical protein